MIECPCCGGAGCEHCEDGRYAVTRCPAEWLGEWIELVQFARQAARGAWPVDGGLLDQSAWFVSVVQFVEGEDRRWTTAST